MTPIAAAQPSRVALATAVLLAILLAGAPATAQDGDPAPSAAIDEQSSAAPSADPLAVTAIDIAELVPSAIGGIEAEVEVVRGAEHIAGLDPDDESHAELIASFEAFVGPLGATIDDMTSVSAVATDDATLSLVAGLQVNGADPGDLLEHYIDTLIAEMAEPYQELGSIGGKTATLVVDEAIDQSVPFYIYGHGQTVWLVIADEVVVEDVLRQLP